MAETDESDRTHETVGGCTLDWSELPVVMVRPPARTLSNEEMQALMDRFWAVASGSGAPYGMVIDLSQAPPMPPKQRQMLTSQIHGASDELAVSCAACGMVFSSPVMRALLTTLLWMVKPPYPTQVFKTRKLATEWVRHQLAAG